jgi:hypothetical protein
MRRAAFAALFSGIAWVVAPAAVGAGAPAAAQDNNRTALIAALESLIATGGPHHTDHDAGQWLQLAVDDAIARGDREIEGLAIRAAAPLLASVSRPVSSTLDLPSISVNSRNVLRLKNPVPYTAQVYASADSAGFVRVAVVESGKSAGQRVDAALSAGAGMPGFHVVQLKAVLTFRTTDRSGTATAWTESRTLPAVFYGVYDPVAESSAAMRALIFGPAAVPARELDPLLGDEPFAAWLSGLLSASRGDKESAPDWLSQYCDERTSEAGARPAAREICSVVYFASRGEIGQIWFRTAELVHTERGLEWSRLAPPRFEGMVMHGAAQESRQLSRLPSLLDASARPIGDVSISPADIEIAAPPRPSGPIDITITVRNAGDGDLHKTLVNVGFGTDPAARGTSRQFVVDIPARESIALKLQAAFPAGYGFVMAHALQLSEHSPHDNWTPDPTPENACALRVVNARLAPPKYTHALMAAAGGCSGQ